MKTPRFSFCLASLLAVSMLLLIQTGCKRWGSPQSPPTPIPAATPSDPKVLDQHNKDRLILAAKQIMTDPNNWKTTAQNLTSFVEAANDLHWEKANEVIQFRNAAQALMNFSTSWIDTLNTSELERLKNISNTLEASATVSVNPRNPNVGGNLSYLDTQGKQEKLNEMQKVVGDKLTYNDAQRFGDLFKAALDAYEALYQKVTRQ